MGKVFLDTNLLVYLFDGDAPAKQERARALLADPGLAGKLLISVQVLQEFYVTVTRKLAHPLDPGMAYRAVQDLTALTVVPTDASLVLLAIARSRKDQLSFWDALIVEAAISGGADRLLTEDMQDGRVHESLRVENPFC